MFASRHTATNALTRPHGHFLRPPCHHQSHSALCRRLRATVRHPRARSLASSRLCRIVALRLRGVPFHEIGRVIGISRISAYRGFKKALHRNTDQDIQTHHRTELAELEMEKANVWRAMDANKEDWRAQMAGTAQLRGIHIRRAKLLGLDAPTKLDVSGIYQRGGADLEAEQRAREAVIEALPIEEQRRIYELFYEAGLRAAAGDLSQPAIETTVSHGPRSRITSDDESSPDRNRPSDAVRDALAWDRVMLRNDLRLYIRQACTWSSHRQSTLKTGTST